MARRGIPKLLRFFYVSLFAIALAHTSACTNSKGLFKSQKNLKKIHDATGEQVASIPIDGAVLSNIDPQRYVEVYGSNGSIQSYCAGRNCDCVFDYFVPQIGDHQVTSTIEYVEENMGRCSKEDLQYSPSVATLRLKHKPTSSYSQGILLDLNTGSQRLDSAQATSYIEGTRMDCQEKIHVPNVLDPKDEGGGSGIYDPIQSEDGRLAFRLNFYLGNAGDVLKKFAESFQVVAPSEIARYECTTRGRNENMRLFSLDIDAPNVNSREIYPFKKGDGPVDLFDRNQFYMMKSPTTAFRTPIIARPAPNSIPTAIGYGVPAAYLDPSQTQEVCPDQEAQYYAVYPYAPRPAIPTGWKWVKLWQLRLVMPNNTRSPKMSNKMVGTGNVLGAVTCKGTAGGEGAGGALNINRDCTGNSLQVSGDPTKLADRILGYTDAGTGNLVGAACVHITEHLLANGTYTFSNSGTGPAGGTTDPVTKLQKNIFDFNRFAPGTDVWHRRNGFADNSCTSASPYDPMRICEQVDYGANPVKHVDRGVPYDSAPVAMSEARFKRQDPSLEDFVLVASPTSIMSADMQNRTGSAGAYIPYRYIPATLCPNVNMEAQQCAAYSGFKYTYEVLLKDLNSKEEPGALNSFPVCVLQKDGG